MKSRFPKILHPVGGRPMVGHAILAARELDPAELAVVVRHERDMVAAAIGELDPDARIVDQDEIPGTGRAVECAMDALGELDGAVVVLAGDVPLLDGGTLAQLLATHRSEGDAVTILSTEVPDATGYGRIVRGPDGQVEAIVEHKDATERQREVREINTSTYVFDAATLRRGLASLERDNAQGEVYLTDIVAFARREGRGVRALITDDSMSVEGVNDRVQLSAIGAEMNRRTCEFWMREGVTVVDPATTWIDADVELAPDVTVLPGVQLHGATKVAGGATIGPDTTLRDTEVAGGATVVRTHAELAVIGEGATVGPFSYLRPGTVLGDRGKIGGFVETKNARIGEGAKVPHLSYVGDAEIGEYTNIGAASVTVNYDGEHKHRTVVGAHARTGADNMFVAPVTVGDGAYTAAGSVIVQDVPAGALGVGRSQQRNIEGWVARKRPGSAAARAAEAAENADQERKAH